MVGTWVSTKSGKIIEVTSENPLMVTGIEIDYLNSVKLRYGKRVVIEKQDIIEEEEDYDDASTL